MRQLWSRGPALVVAGALALVVGAWWGLVAGGGPESEPDSPRRSTPAVDLGDVMDFVPKCTIDTCRILARRDGFRFDGAAASLIVVAPRGECDDNLGLHLVTPAKVLWSAAVGARCLDPVGGIETDRTGNAFLDVTTADGAGEVIALRIRGDEVEDFGSLDHRFSGHESTAARDRDGDGVAEIVVRDADGDERVYRWNGRDYH